MKTRFLLLFFVCFLTSCDQGPAVRAYTEIVVLPSDTPTTASFDGIHAPFLESVSQQPRMDFSQQDADTQKMLMASLGSASLAWKTPKGWQENPGDGMRVVSFESEGADPISCTIISLGGQAGGIQANIQRWLKQINITDISNEKLQSFLSQQELITAAGGWETSVIDFTALQTNQQPDAPSMMAAIFTIDQNSVFVKMTGTKKAIQENMEKFKSLCLSLNRNESNT